MSRTGLTDQTWDRSLGLTRLIRLGGGRLMTAGMDGREQLGEIVFRHVRFRTQACRLGSQAGDFRTDVVAIVCGQVDRREDAFRSRQRRGWPRMKKRFAARTATPAWRRFRSRGRQRSRLSHGNDSRRKELPCNTPPAARRLPARCLRNLDFVPSCSTGNQVGPPVLRTPNGKECFPSGISFPY